MTQVVAQVVACILALDALVGPLVFGPQAQPNLGDPRLPALVKQFNG